MSITISHLQPVVALIAGILILLVPRLLNYIVAIYLIVIGILGLIRQRRAAEPGTKSGILRFISIIYLRGFAPRGISRLRRPDAS
jgi:uncharacterized membrane protein YdbT with pleckstrin-like domain